MSKWLYTIKMNPEFTAYQDVDLDGNPQGTIKAVIAKFEHEVGKLPGHIRDGVDYLVCRLQDLVTDAGEDDVDPDEFDAVWNEVYNWSDSNKVWIETILEH